MKNKKHSLLLVLLLTMMSQTSVQAAAKAPAEGEAAQAEELYGKENRPLGNFVLGPNASFGILNLASLGVEAKYKDVIGLSTSYGFLPQLTISSAKIKSDGWDIRLKYYPTKRSFYVGVGIGHHTLTGQMTKDILGISTTGILTQDNTFILPHAGWNWIWKSGFYLGLDFGVQVALKSNNRFGTNVYDANVLASADYIALNEDIKKKANAITSILPMITLIKIGYFF